jgi:FdhE protein
MSSWALRAERARELARHDSSASEILTFYADLAAFQGSLRPRSQAVSPAGLGFARSVDLDSAAAAVPHFLAWLNGHGPAQLANAAAELVRLESVEWLELIRLALQEDDLAEADDAAAFVVEAVVQPFAEQAAAGVRDRPAPPPNTARCPICQGRPLVGSLREAGHGARRVLTCARCLAEWDFLRVLCPACGEERFDKLPVFTSETVEHVRIEACDACRLYLKTVDLTKNGLAVPVVDDLATVALDLWARDQGYSRIRANLLRT